MFYLCTSSYIWSRNHKKGKTLVTKEGEHYETEKESKLCVIEKKLYSRNELRFSEIYSSHSGEEKRAKTKLEKYSSRKCIRTIGNEKANLQLAKEKKPR